MIFYSHIIGKYGVWSSILKTQWFLQSHGADGSFVDFVITRLPCRIGRGRENDLVISNLGLSRFHAIMTRDISGRIRLIDENSTNGTFANRRRIDGYCLLRENDIIHFAGAEFKLLRRNVEEGDSVSFDEMMTMVIAEGTPLPEHFAPNEMEFDELLMGQGLSVAAQPIVDAQSRKVVGYEILGRANHPQLPHTPIELFELAHILGREIDLSVAFRDFGVHRIAPFLNGHALFINAHPKETFSDLFLSSLGALQRSLPSINNIVVEIHESAVTDIEQLRQLADSLDKMGIRFAYDDFGAGQARMLELADIPAHFVKFDIALVGGLHKASERKQKVVRDLVQMVLAAGSIPLAEGIECEEDAKMCISIGFQLIQGNFTGEPIPEDSLQYAL